MTCVFSVDKSKSQNGRYFVLIFIFSYVFILFMSCWYICVLIYLGFILAVILWVNFSLYATKCCSQIIILWITIISRDNISSLFSVCRRPSGIQMCLAECCAGSCLQMMWKAVSVSDGKSNVERKKWESESSTCVCFIAMMLQIMFKCTHLPLFCFCSSSFAADLLSLYLHSLWTSQIQALFFSSSVFHPSSSVIVVSATWWLTFCYEEYLWCFKSLWWCCGDLFLTGWENVAPTTSSVSEMKLHQIQSCLVLLHLLYSNVVYVYV